MLLYLLLILAVVSLFGGAWGNSRYGYVGWSPAGIILLVLALMYFTGRLTIR